MLLVARPSVGQLRVGRNLAQFNPAAVFVNDMAPILWETAVRHTLDPVVVIAQSGHETGWGRFTGKVPVTFHNTCGLKIHNPALAGDQESTLAHAQFASWGAGAEAHAQHLCAYLQMQFFDGPLLDPRWVHVFGKKAAITDVEQLGGSWAPNPAYGNLVAEIASKLKA